MSTNQSGQNQVLVTIARSDSRLQTTFRVERVEPMMVLDALLAIRRDHDPSLGFLYSCRVGMCGTCTLRLDGRPVLACQTPIDDSMTRIRLDPMGGLPIHRDLIVDMTPFYDQWSKIIPYLVPAEGLDDLAQVSPQSAERRLIDPSLDCITCGACFSACSVADSQRNFLGPAALTRAMILIADSRDVAGEQRLDVATQHEGVWQCHYIHGCTVACPKGLDPAKAIRQIRRWKMRR